MQLGWPVLGNACRVMMEESLTNARLDDLEGDWDAVKMTLGDGPWAQDMDGTDP